MPSPIESVLTAAREFLGERLSCAEADRALHGHGQDPYPPVPPAAVAFAENTEEVSRLLALCHAQGVPVTPFTAGTALGGHVTPVHGGISLDLSRMDKVLAINADDLDARVEAGVKHRALAEILKEKGLFFPVDPGSDSSLGGMCATRASGTATVLYGTVRDNVLGLTVVLADGRVIHPGRRVRKSATGYDLTRLFIGSEGTLGVITEIQIRLRALPAAVSAAVCQFPTLADAVNTVIAVQQASIPVARSELMDEVEMGACIGYSGLEGFQALPTLFFEFHGASPRSVQEQAEATGAIAAAHGGSGFAWATAAEERARLWKARYDGFWAGQSLIPGCTALSTDAVVPISRLAEMILGAKEDIRASGMTAPIVGHAGEGNFHALILLPPGDAQAQEQAEILDRKIVARAMALGGSCSGEHGIGLGKMEFMREEHGEDALDVMRAIKHALDPRGILNPGKMLPDKEGVLLSGKENQESFIL